MRTFGRKVMKLFTFSKPMQDKFAHKKGDAFETFTDHSDRAQKYFDLLVEKHGLREVFSKLLSHFGFDEKMYDLIRDIAKFHDLGKLTEEFQKGLQKGKVDVTHSDVGFYVILSLLVDLCEKSVVSEDELIFLSLISSCVLRHHSSLQDIENLKFWNPKKEAQVRYVLQFINIDTDVEKILEISQNIASNLRQPKKAFKKYYCIEGFLLYKLVNSLLVTSDFLATAEFMEGLSFEPDTITPQLVEQIEKNISSTNIPNNFNPYIDEQFQELLKTDPAHITNINQMRSVIAANIESTFEKSDKNVFFLEVPTGGGKTNISLRLVRRMMSSKKKVFYVLPYINIIEQSYDYFSKFVPQDEITRYDSRYIDLSDYEDRLNERYDPAQVEELTRSKYYDTIFLNFPFIFTTHVGFFDLFFRKGKSENFNFYQIANSVVILDEIQAYNPEYWNILSQIFFALGKYFNTTVIIMSATLPSLSRFVTNGDEMMCDLTPQKLCTHPLFNRVKSEFLNDKEDNISSYITESIEKHDYRKILVVVNTVKSSLNMYNRLRDEFAGAEVCILNSTITNLRRKELIEHIKNYYGEKPLILVSTQSIEAGVDLDFDIGFRAFALLDSIIQVSGRVNRNGLRKDAVLYIFDDPSWKRIYRDDMRKKILEDNISKFKNNQLDLKQFYNMTIDELLRQMKIITVTDNFSYFEQLMFEKVDREIKLIEGDNIQLFIPFDVELDRIPQWRGLLFDYGLISLEDTCLSGKKVWEMYQNAEFDIRKFKSFSKILGIFTVSLYNYTTSEGKRLRSVLKDEIQKGMYYASDYENYYDYYSGLDVEKFVTKKLSSEYDFI